MSKSNFIEAGLLSIGVFVASLGIQGNAKASINNIHGKTKYGDQQHHYAVSRHVSYFKQNNITNNSSQFLSQGNQTKQNNSTQKTTSPIPPKTNNPIVSKDKNNSYQPTRIASHHIKKATSNYHQVKRYQKNSVTTQLKSQQSQSNDYNAKVHKVSNNNVANSQASQASLGFSANSSSSFNQQSTSDSSASIETQSNATNDTTYQATNGITDQSIRNLITESKRYLGASYEYGGTGQNETFDCSGFTQYLYQHQKIKLPRTAQQQYDSYQHVDASQAKAGDLVFFGSDAADISHVGIYLGNGQMIDAQDQGVIIEAVNAPWWNLIGYARITN